jgi:predicted nucleic acid-binding protein
VIALAVWRPTTIGLETLERAWEIEDRFAFSWWDSLILAAAVDMRCRHLLTEDLQDGQVVDGVTILNPFLHAPSDVLG